jgi:hypothetical protein
LLPQAKFFFPTQAKNGGDAVAQVDSELSRIVDMAVCVDQSWNNRPSLCVDPIRPGWHFDSFAYGFNPPIANY